MYTHALLLGCTGMLRAASVAIASRSRLVTSVARTGRSLDAVDAGVRDLPVEHVRLALDWSRPDEYLDRLFESLDATGPPDLVVAWVHPDDVVGRLVRRLDDAAVDCDVLHVVGSARRDPARVAVEIRAALGEPRAVRYRQAVLGSRRSGAERRWLTDDEISDGVLEALEDGSPAFAVGDLDETR